MTVKPSAAAVAAADRAGLTVVNSTNAFRLEGQKTGAYEIVEQLGNCIDPSQPAEKNVVVRRKKGLTQTYQDKSFNGVTEWAYGVSPWFEAGLYLPLYTHDKNLGFGIDGFKLRALAATPNGADRTVAFGLGMELSFNTDRWDENNVTSEFRPIIAWHVNKQWDIIVNPIVDTAYDGFDNLVFAPSARIAYNAPNDWAFALENYSDFGRLSDFSPRAEQAHQLYGVVGHVLKNGLEWEFGAGVGLTDAADKFTMKLILAKDLFVRK